MQINIRIEKRHFYIILSVLTLIVLGVLGYAQTSSNVDTTKPWHPLHQVSKSDSNMASVDANSNGVVDMAESIAGLTSKCTLLAHSSAVEKGAQFVDVPSYCKAGLCLLLVQGIKGDTTTTDTPSMGNVIDMQIEFYFQIQGDAENPETIERWETIGSIIGNGNNGDTEEKLISQIKAKVESIPVPVIQLFDDKGSEKETTKWTYKDLNDKKYGGRLFACQL